MKGKIRRWTWTPEEDAKLVQLIQQQIEATGQPNHKRVAALLNQGTDKRRTTSSIIRRFSKIKSGEVKLPEGVDFPPQTNEHTKAAAEPQGKEHQEAYTNAILALIDAGPSTPTSNNDFRQVMLGKRLFEIYFNSDHDVLFSNDRLDGRPKMNAIMKDGVTKELGYSTDRLWLCLYAGAVHEHLKLMSSPLYSEKAAPIRWDKMGLIGRRIKDISKWEAMVKYTRDHRLSFEALRLQLGGKTRDRLPSQKGSRAADEPFSGPEQLSFIDTPVAQEPQPANLWDRLKQFETPLASHRVHIEMQADEYERLKRAAKLAHVSENELVLRIVRMFLADVSGGK